MNEEVFRFGPNNRLTGILTTPDQGNSAPGPIAVVCNAGIVHHIGPFRLHVRIARMLARIGISTLRLDLSGLGDSAPRTGKNQDSNRAVTDIVAALNQLTIQTGIEEFVMIGLCSGAFSDDRGRVRI
jgi:alpha/beta superfamily hydrolase